MPDRWTLTRRELHDLTFVVGAAAGAWIADWRAIALFAFLVLVRDLYWRRRRDGHPDRTDDR